MTLHDTYEQTPYPGLCYQQSHIDRLATISHLMGQSPTDVHHARVLEIGCAEGGNLIPMALALPDSEFIGIDFSAKQIEEGQVVINHLGLTNIQLLTMDIREIPADMGEFDYIIAHGIYSWVPDDVKEALLQAYRTHLKPDGVGYISYNVFPGWHMMQIARNGMQYHTRHIDNPKEKAAAAREFIDFLVAANPNPERDAYSAFLHGYRVLQEKQLEESRPRDDSALLHDELEVHNDPVYFHQFADHISQYNLQYLSEAEFHMVMPTRFPQEAVQQVQQIAKDIIEVEQYYDFLRNRMFRKTLICHEEAKINRSLEPGRLLNLYVSAPARPVEAKENDPPEMQRYEGSDGSQFATDHPLSITAFQMLQEIAPQPMAFKALVPAACQQAGVAPSDEENVQTLILNLLQAYAYSDQLIQLHSTSLPFVRHISEKPVASPFARYQVQIYRRVTNMIHGRVELGGISLRILPYLDGEHTHDDLLNILIEAVQSGEISLEHQGERITDLERLRPMMQHEMELTLRWLATSALLIA